MAVTRIALGAVVLAGERLGVSDRARASLATVTGVASRTAAGVGEAAEVALGFVTFAKLRGAAAAEQARGIPATLTAPLRGGRDKLRGGRDRLRDELAEARATGNAKIEAGRVEALAFLRTSVDDGIAWAQENVVPKVIEGALPEIRRRVIPVVIEDLTADPRVRDLVVEQGRGVIGDTAIQLRNGTAAADDRVEKAYRRVFGSGTA
jgi:hypothetical protein